MFGGLFFLFYICPIKKTHIMQNTKLKSAIYVQPFSTVQSERYVVENQADLNAFFKAFPENKRFLGDTLKKDLLQGKIIILTDATMSGFSSYCYETVLGDREISEVHPTSFIRVTFEDLKQELIDKVIDQIKTDINEGDTTVLEELLKAVATRLLLHSLPEEQWDGFSLLAK